MIQRNPSSPITRVLRQALWLGAPALLSASFVTWGCSDPAAPAGGAGTGAGGTSGGATVTSGGATVTSGGATVTSGGAVGSGGAVNTTVPACVTQVISEQCLICHSTAAAPTFGGLVLEGNFVPNLVDRPASYKTVPDTTKCLQGAKLIDSNLPADSVMLKKILGTQACGSVMPNLGVPLAQAQKDCLQQWIMTF